MLGQKPRGLTLLEVVMVTAILAAFVFLAAPLFSTMIARQRLAGALQQVAADLRSVQGQAVTRGDLVRLRHGADPSLGAPQPQQYRFERSADGGTTWTVLTAWRGLRDYGDSMFQAIRDTDGAGTQRYEVRFNAQGVVINNGVPTGSYPLMIMITRGGQTGRIRVLRTGTVTIL